MAIHEECGVFGVMSTRRENVAGIGEMIGVDSLGYLPLERLNQLVDSEEYCAACFNGEYPTRVPTDLRKDRFERKLSERAGTAK